MEIQILFWELFGLSVKFSEPEEKNLIILSKSSAVNYTKKAENDRKLHSAVFSKDNKNLLRTFNLTST